MFMFSVFVCLSAGLQKLSATGWNSRRGLTVKAVVTPPVARNTAKCTFGNNKVRAVMERRWVAQSYI